MDQIIKTFPFSTNLLLFVANCLDKLALFFKNLQEKIILLIPAKEGSDLKFLQETIIAQQEFKKGNYKTFDNVKDLIADLHNAKTA